MKPKSKPPPLDNGERPGADVPKSPAAEDNPLNSSLAGSGKNEPERPASQQTPNLGQSMYCWVHSRL